VDVRVRRVEVLDLRVELLLDRRILGDADEQVDVAARVELAAALPDAAADALPPAALPDAAVDALTPGAELAACNITGEAPAPLEQAATSPTVARSVAIRFIDFPPPTPDPVGRA